MNADEIVIRPVGAARLTGAILVFCAVVFTVWAQIASGLAGLGIVLFTGPLALLGIAAHRIEVRATPTVLRINNGLRLRTIPWDRVQGFRIVASHGQRHELALIEPSEAVTLPIANGGTMLTRRNELNALQDRLERYRATVTTLASDA